MSQFCDNSGLCWGMLRKVPPLEAIEIFVAAARGDSFRAVGRALALSPSAVSRRIATLEDFLGTQLFDRSGQSQTLSAAGRRYLSLVEPALGAIQGASSALGRSDRRLQIATSHSFAAGWLLPRLAELSLNLGIDVEVVPSRDFDVLRSGEAQLGLWGGLDRPTDMEAEAVAEALVFPVAAPVMADGRRPPTSEAELAAHTLLSVRSPSRVWDRWFAMAEAPPPVYEVREFATLQMMYEAAASGLGIALAMPLVAEPYLRSGRLLPCTPVARSLGEAYRLYRPMRRRGRSDTEQRFAHWLHAAAAESVRDHRRIIGAG